jgi:2-desacetyl-2-hydroxyethyl bacteriochlorophyllide A dehydrogenase
MAMTKKMKAGIYSGPEDIRLKEIPVPTVKPGHVLVRNKASGICGSDLHEYFGDWKQPTDTASGHEFSGVVVEVNSDVSAIAKGNHVCAECFSHCGKCTFCRTGLYNLCTDRSYIGNREGHGGFAEYALLPASSVFILPDSLSFEEGALIEPLAVAYRSIFRTQPRSLDHIAILGAGTIGLCCVAVSKAIGVRKVLITAKYEQQAKMAKILGADQIIQTSTESLERTIDEARDNGAIDIVIDTIATEQTFQDALAITRKGGTVCLVGGYTYPFRVFLAPIVSKELQVIGSMCYGYSGMQKDFEAVIKLVAQKKINALPLITHRFPLSEISQAFHTAADKTSGSIKVLITSYKLAR